MPKKKYPYEKYIDNETGKVAVLYSPGFGAGWSTWADKEQAEAVTFDREIVELLLKKDTNGIKVLMKKKYRDFYDGGLDGLQVYWVEPGTEFQIIEYDGSESIETRNEVNWWVA